MGSCSSCRNYTLRHSIVDESNPNFKKGVTIAYNTHRFEEVWSSKKDVTYYGRVFFVDLKDNHTSTHRVTRFIGVYAPTAGVQASSDPKDVNDTKTFWTQLTEAAKGAPGNRFVVMGDFNARFEHDTTAVRTECGPYGCATYMNTPAVGSDSRDNMVKFANGQKPLTSGTTQVHKKSTAAMNWFSAASSVAGGWTHQGRKGTHKAQVDHIFLSEQLWTDLPGSSPFPATSVPTQAKNTQRVKKVIKKAGVQNVPTTGAGNSDHRPVFAKIVI